MEGYLYQGSPEKQNQIYYRNWLTGLWRLGSPTLAMYKLENQETRQCNSVCLKIQASLVAQMVRASVCNAGDPGSIPGWGRSSGEGNGNPLQYSCLENSMDGGAWWATVHGVAKSRTRLSNFTFTFTYKVQEPGWLMSKGKEKMDISTQAERVNLPFLHLFVLIRPFKGLDNVHLYQ